MTTLIYTIPQLLKVVRRLPTHTPIADSITITSYDSHKDHWIAWLREYNSPGYYGRSHFDRDAAYCYAHVQNVGMIIWLNEATGIGAPLVQKAKGLALIASDRRAAQCGRARRVLPWRPLQQALSLV